MESYRKEIQSMITTTEIVNLIQTFQQELFLYSKKFPDHTEPLKIHLKEKKYSGRRIFFSVFLHSTIQQSLGPRQLQSLAPWEIYLAAASQEDAI